MAAHSTFDCAFQHADDARINSLPLHKCPLALQTFVRLAKNLFEEITVCQKQARVEQRQLELIAQEKLLYKDACSQLLAKLEKFAKEKDASESYFLTSPIMEIPIPNKITGITRLPKHSGPVFFFNYPLSGEQYAFRSSW